MSKKFLDYHIHTDFSSCVTNIDSVTKVSMYIERAVEMGKTAFCFSEHGSVLNWYEKKTAIENAGMKYIHAMEAYVTETLEEKVRDNYHMVLLARNHDGFKEINRLMTNSFNRNDNHYYYQPRMCLEDIMSTTDNIIITTACLGGLMAKGNQRVKERFIEFMLKNKERCFLEIQHHNVEKQIIYNQELLDLHKGTGLKLIAGTDTHSLNKELAEARIILQKSKNIYFDEEEGWDLTLKTYDELVAFYKKQNSIPEQYYLEAIENTNLVERMVEEFKIDTSPKYPKLYDDSESEFKKIVYKAIDEHPYATKNHSREEIITRIEEEIPVYEKTNTIDFILFQKFIRDWEKSNNIYCGYGRGSISGSFIAYLLGITEMDSIKFDLNFFRFLNPDRVSNCDVDSDYYEPDRNKVRGFLLESEILNSAEIITFNTIALKGAIKDVGRALGIPVSETQEISNAVYLEDRRWVIDDKYREKYPELFKYVDLVSGTIVSIGSHPAGVLCATSNINEDIGMITIKSSKYPVSSIDMYGLDNCFYVKLDCLGLDNVGLINETCNLVGIDRLTPDNFDLEDMDVWRSIAEDTSMVFQWESKKNCSR
jgi:DNA polymerase-3 subunit alpha